MKYLIALLLILTPVAATSGVHFNIHAGIKSSSIAPGYNYGYGASLTLGRKSKPPGYLSDRPPYYNYNLHCPTGSVPVLNKRTTLWFCGFY